MKVTCTKCSSVFNAIERKRDMLVEFVVAKSPGTQKVASWVYDLPKDRELLDISCPICFDTFVRKNTGQLVKGIRK